MKEITDMLNTVIQGDCLEVMKQMPDKCVDLVLTDPPYGLGLRTVAGGTTKNKQTRFIADMKETQWDNETPNKEVFAEIFRISKNQIICGGNYFELPPTRGFIFWDKQQFMPTMSACEYIWTSFDCPAKIATFSSKDANRHHPTQKPVELIRWLLNKFSNYGDVVLDPFLGSGTTAVACKQLNRKYIGIELSQKYCDIANERLKQDLLF